MACSATLMVLPLENICFSSTLKTTKYILTVPLRKMLNIKGLFLLAKDYHISMKRLSLKKDEKIARDQQISM